MRTCLLADKFHVTFKKPLFSHNYSFNQALAEEHEKIELTVPPVGVRELYFHLLRG